MTLDYIADVRLIDSPVKGEKGWRLVAVTQSRSGEIFIVAKHVPRLDESFHFRDLVVKLAIAKAFLADKESGQ